MDELQMEKLKSACIVMGEALSGVSAMFRSVVDGMVEAAAGLTSDPIWEEDKSDPYAALTRLAEEMQKSIAEQVDMIAEPVDLEIPKKIPRPPKCLGPVNKANYAANRPPRRARSSCRIIKH